MLIDATKPPQPMFMEPSKAAMPFANIIQLPSVRPWADVIFDYLDDPENFPATDDTEFRVTHKGPPSVMRTATHRILNHLIADKIVALHAATNGEKISGDDAKEIFTSVETWHRASAEAVLLTIHEEVRDLETVPCHASFQSFQAWSAMMNHTRPEANIILSVDFPAFAARPRFADGSLVDLVWMAYEPTGDRCFMTALGKIGDADQAFPLLSFDFEWNDFDDFNELVASAVARKGGPDGPHADQTKADMTAFAPWVEAYMSAFVNASDKDAQFDMSIGMSASSGYPSIIPSIELDEIDLQHYGFPVLLV